MIAQYVSTRRDPALYASPVTPKDGYFTGSVLLAYKLNWQTVLYVGYGDNRELTTDTQKLVALGAGSSSSSSRTPSSGDLRRASPADEHTRQARQGETRSHGADAVARVRGHGRQRCICSMGAPEYPFCLAPAAMAAPPRRGRGKPDASIAGIRKT